jgi:hypothetical protein
MTGRHKPNDGGQAPRLSGAPLDDAGVRRQLARLFGESLFGPWPQLQQDPGAPRKRRRSKRWLVQLLAVLALAAAGFGLHSLVAPGLERQRDNRREQYAQDLKAFYSDGNLEKASQYLQLLREHPSNRQAGDIEPKDAYLDLMVAVDAALYRYFDASPERLRRIRPYLDETGRASPLRQVAHLTILSREERAAKLSEIEELRNDRPDRNELEYLLATAQEYRNDVQSSREAWQRSARAEPAWLGHRFEQAWFELRHDQRPTAQQIASDMAHVDADSPWSKLAASAIGNPKELAVVPTHSDAAVAVPTPVNVYFEKLLSAILAAHHKDVAQARTRLLEAAAAVEYQAPFLFDAFDWCVDENEPGLARELTTIPEWPRDSKVAGSKLQRLSRELPIIQRSYPRSLSP